MGIFSKLFGETAPVFDERIWLTDAAKVADLVQRVRGSSETGSYPLVVHHFEDTGASVESALKRADVSCRRFTDFAAVRTANVSSWRAGAQAMILDATLLPWEVRNGETHKSPGSDAPRADVHLVEHYPLPTGDAHVLNLLPALGLTGALTCYTSLDEPWLHHFGGARLREVITRLGLDESERLEHTMITKALHKAQDRISKQTPQEIPCATCGDWVRRNLDPR